MKDWEIIADDLKKAGWSLGWVSTLNLEERTIWIVGRARLRKAFRRAWRRNLDCLSGTATGDTRVRGELSLLNGIKCALHIIRAAEICSTEPKYTFSTFLKKLACHSSPDLST
jgi:hypothetical protein